MQDMPTNIQNLESYATEILPPLLLLVPYNPQHPVCESLWGHVRRAALKQSTLYHFTLELLDPLSERTQTIKIRCLGGGTLDTDWDTTYELRDINDSGHPCNTPHPPCLRKPIETRATPPDADQPHITPSTLWERLQFWKHPDSRRSLTRDNQELFPEDTEIRELALLRSSVLISPDLRTYRVIIQIHSRVDTSGRKIVFSVTFFFGRCGRGENTLSIRCQYGDQDGLIVDIQ